MFRSAQKIFSTINQLQMYSYKLFILLCITLFSLLFRQPHFPDQSSSFSACSVDVISYFSPSPILLSIHLSYYPLLLHSFTQNLPVLHIISALVCFCTHWTDFLNFWTYIIGFSILVSFFVNFLFLPRAEAGYSSVFERVLNIIVLCCVDITHHLSVAN